MTDKSKDDYRGPSLRRFAAPLRMTATTKANTEILSFAQNDDYRRSAVIFMERSAAGAEWVSAPTEMKSTPVLA